MLTLDKGLPLAEINGGPLDSEIVSIKKKDTLCSCCGGCDDRCIIEKCCKKCKRKVKTYDLGTDVKFDDKVMFTPLIDERDVIFLAAQSGSGKSTLIRKYADLYHEIEPKNPVLVFSRKTDDPVFKNNYIKLVNLNALDVDNDYDLLDNPSFKNGGLLIFDDTNTILNKKLRDKVTGIMHDMLETGRAKKINLAISYHMLNPNERKDGRVLWNESRGVVMFPGHNERAEEYALREYLGFDNDTIKKIMTLNTRWVMIRKIPPYPKVVIYENGLFIPKSKYEK